MIKRQRRERNKPSKIITDGQITYIEIRLNGTQTIIDTVDLPLVEGIKWAFAKGYVGKSCKLGEKSLRLHRVIMGVDNPKIRVDHINGNTLDNRRNNLRLCNAAQNAWNQIGVRKNNTSGFTGVSKNKKNWMAYIQINRKRHILGTFKTIQEAANVRKDAESVFFGEFAHKN